MISFWVPLSMLQITSFSCICIGLELFCRRWLNRGVCLVCQQTKASAYKQAKGMKGPSLPSSSSKAMNKWVWELSTARNGFEAKQQFHETSRQEPIVMS